MAEAFDPAFPGTWPEPQQSMFYAAIDGLNDGDPAPLAAYLRGGFPLDGGLRDILASALVDEYVGADHDLDPFRLRLAHRPGWTPLSRRWCNAQRDEDAAAYVWVLRRMGVGYKQARERAATAMVMSEPNVDRACTEFRRSFDDDGCGIWAYAAAVRAWKKIQPDANEQWIEEALGEHLKPIE